MKIAVIGAGSTYTPELINGFLERVDRLPIQEIWLMDIDPSRLEIVSEFVQRLAQQAGDPFQIIPSDNLQQSLAAADIVVTQFRVGQMQARRQDEYLGKRHALVGQETTGIGGMAKALRTIPHIMQICEIIQQDAPEALLLNFTNPSGLIMEAIQRYAPNLKAAGVCNSAYTAKMKILEHLSSMHGVAYQAEDGELLTLGLNHLTWHYGFLLKGRDVWEEVFAGYLQHLRQMEDPPFHPDFVQRQGVIPNDYLEYYFQTHRKIAAQDHWPPSRAEQVMEVEKKLLARYADPDCTSIPPALMERGGAYYSSVAASMIESYWNNLAETHVANVSHNGQVRGWEKDWVLEMPCKVDRAGVHPLPTPPLPLYNYAFIEQVKQYELITIEAAVHGDHQAALRALVTHPLGPSEEKAAAVLEDLLKTNQPYLPRFFL